VIAEKLNSTDRVDELDLVALWRILRTHRGVVVSATVICGVVAAVLAILAIPIFRAEVSITPVAQQSIGVSGALGQLSGLASLAGVSMGTGASPQRDALAVLRSRHLVEEFIKRNDLLPALFRSSSKPPSLWLGVKKFQAGIVNIREDTRQGVIVVAIEWTEPATAARWANGFVALANELLRTRALDESTRNIAYLKDQAIRTDVVNLQRVMYDLIESETKTLMLANGRPEYAFTVVDPAVPPEIKTSPHRAIMVLVGLAVGFMVGAIIAFWRNTVSKSKRPV
jgi:uncharacterized protein involved in exopolysaccharide biosynthesis